MTASFLTSVIQQYYPATAEKIKILIESNVLLEKLAVAVYEKIESSVQKYADIASRLNVLTRLTKAWRNKEYTEVSYVTVFLSVAILLYFVSPIDLVPDFIPIVGGLDDVLLLGFLLKMIDKEIERFLTWEKENNFKN
ncbi:MAG: DUF1232 domain-containing protein [Chitinophagales bacterium]|jgi:uncharacterized membrane protein YkvA (DUF1232 family)|nr:DUF1232 domain-containing protein [Chitinophagales bacterium]MBP6323869.1 DUF1232 domain-containing protein [Chitinophagales bacterium]